MTSRQILSATVAAILAIGVSTSAFAQAGGATGGASSGSTSGGTPGGGTPGSSHGTSAARIADQHARANGPVPVEKGERAGGCRLLVEQIADQDHVIALRQGSRSVEQILNQHLDVHIVRHSVDCDCTFRERIDVGCDHR